MTQVRRRRSRASRMYASMHILTVDRKREPALVSRPELSFSLGVQRNMKAAHEAASAVGNQDNSSTPAAAQGSGPAISEVSSGYWCSYVLFQKPISGVVPTYALSATLAACRLGPWLNERHRQARPVRRDITSQTFCFIPQVAFHSF